MRNIELAPFVESEADWNFLITALRGDMAVVVRVGILARALGRGFVEAGLLDEPTEIAKAITPLAIEERIGVRLLPTDHVASGMGSRWSAIHTKAGWGDKWIDAELDLRDEAIAEARGDHSKAAAA